jgi:hypothetical protein
MVFCLTMRKNAAFLSLLIFSSSVVRLIDVLDMIITRVLSPSHTDSVLDMIITRVLSPSHTCCCSWDGSIAVGARVVPPLPLICPLCGQQYKRSSSLTLHMKIFGTHVFGLFSLFSKKSQRQMEPESMWGNAGKDIYIFFGKESLGGLTFYSCSTSLGNWLVEHPVRR